MITLSRKRSVVNSKPMLTRKKFLEITVILFTILLAGLLGSYSAEMLTRQIANDLTKFIAGIFIGLVVGAATGFAVKRTWDGYQRRHLKI